MVCAVGSAVADLEQLHPPPPLPIDCVCLFSIFVSHTVKPCKDGGAYGHDPLWRVFEEHRLDSTTTDITTALFILKIMSLYYLILWNQVDILQKHFKKDHVQMRLWTRFYQNVKKIRLRMHERATKTPRSSGPLSWGISLSWMCARAHIVLIVHIPPSPLKSESWWKCHR